MCHAAYAQCVQLLLACRTQLPLSFSIKPAAHRQCFDSFWVISRVYKWKKCLPPSRFSTVPLSSRCPHGVQCPLCVLNGIKPNRNWKGVAVSACCRRLLCERVPVLYFRFSFFHFFFFFAFRFFHSAFAFVIKWNLARRLAALNASQCAAIFISFNAHTNRLRKGERREVWGAVVAPTWQWESAHK